MDFECVPMILGTMLSGASNTIPRWQRGASEGGLVKNKAKVELLSS